MLEKGLNSFWINNSIALSYIKVHTSQPHQELWKQFKHSWIKYLNLINVIIPPGHSGVITCMMVPKNTNHLVTGSEDTSVIIFDIKTQAVKTRLWWVEHISHQAARLAWKLGKHKQSEIFIEFSQRAGNNAAVVCVETAWKFIISSLSTAESGKIFTMMMMSCLIYHAGILNGVGKKWKMCVSDDARGAKRRKILKNLYKNLTKSSYQRLFGSDVRIHRVSHQREMSGNGRRQKVTAKIFIILIAAPWYPRSLIPSSFLVYGETTSSATFTHNGSNQLNQLGAHTAHTKDVRKLSDSLFSPPLLPCFCHIHTELNADKMNNSRDSFLLR